MGQLLGHGSVLLQHNEEQPDDPNGGSDHGLLLEGDGRRKQDLFIISCFMKKELIVILLAYSWAIFVQNSGGWVSTLEVRFFLWIGVVL